LTLFGSRVTGSDVWYWITGGLLVLGTWVALNLDETPTGRAFRALHDSEVAAQVVGVDVARFKLQAFVIAAVYASIAGSLLALMNGFINPDQAGFLHSIELVTMVVLGGLGSIVGSIVGAALLVTLPQALTVFQEYEHLMLGLIIIASMIFMRRGIVPTLSAALARRARS
jgi:branched-chain amino acid transport system permease protein